MERRESKMESWRKVCASFFAFIMMFQACSGVLDIYAKELGKVKSATTYGEYYNKTCPSNLTLNKDLGINETPQTLTKDVDTNNTTREYDENQEVVEKREIDSKTYEITKGTYVKEIYFEPIHKEVDGTFIDINNTLENTSKTRSAPIYENIEGSYKFKVQDDKMSMTNDNNQSLVLANTSANLNAYDTKENTILYSEAYPNIDMEYQLGGKAISTNFNINGPIQTNTITFSLTYNDLTVKEYDEYLEFLDKEEKSIFTYQKPILQDSLGEVSGAEFLYTVKDNTLDVTITLPSAWIASVERTFPIKMSTRVADERKELLVNSSYIRSRNPNTNSQYHDLFVGYEDGSLSGGYHFGIARTYMHVGNLQLGPDKKIVSANLQMYKILSNDQQWNTIAVGMTDNYVNVEKLTWNTKPSSITHVNTTTIANSPGWQSLDVTSYIQGIYNNKNNVIEIKATNESIDYAANVFYSESGLEVPKIIVTYRDAYDVNPELELDIMDTEMRIYSKKDQGFYGLSFDGIAKPDSTVDFLLVEKGKNEVLQTESASSSRYFVNPVFTANPLENVQSYTKRDVNYTTGYILESRLPQYDVPYEYLMKVTHKGASSTLELRSDAIIKYKVKLGDTLKTIAAYYGVAIADIKADNNFQTDSIQEGQVLIVRMKKNNPKVSVDVYTPPLRTVEYKAKYVNRGPRCYGSCDIIDPVNANIGNYFYESTDFTLIDYDTLPFHRYYNSVGPVVSGMFGNGFTTTLESYISYDANKNIVFFMGDGKIYQIPKVGSGYVPNAKDKLKIEQVNNLVKIYHHESKTTYQFDTFGTLVSITDENGQTMNVEYDDYGMITKMHLGQKVIKFTYNSTNLVKEIELPDGSKTSYQYDNKRNLIKYTDTAGKSESYYFDNNRMTYMTNKNGDKTAKNTYDSEGRVTLQEDANGNTSTLTYSANKTTVTNSDGSTDVYGYNNDYKTTTINQNGKTSSSYTYDEYGNIASEKDGNGDVTTYTYNKNDLLKTKYPDATYEEYQYDSEHNVTYHRDTTGVETRYQYNGKDLLSFSQGKEKTTYEYDIQHRVLKEYDHLGSSKTYTYSGNQVATITHVNGLVESYSYDANGNILKESNNQGKWTGYVYNNRSEVIQKNHYDGSNEKWNYDDYGNVHSYQDRLGAITTYSYDNNHNQTKSIKGKLTSSKTYNSMNQIVSETNEQGQTTKYTYDVYGNKKEEIDSYGNITKYEYDIKKNLIKTTDPWKKTEENKYEQGRLVKTISKEGLETSYEYDAFSREIKRTNPNGTVELKSYDKNNNIKEEVDAQGASTNYQYDDYGRAITITKTDADGQKTVTKKTYDVYGNVISEEVDGRKTKYTYDMFQRQNSVTNAMNQVTRTEYDIEGRVTKEIDALGQYATTSYNANGDVVAKTDKRGNTETKTYNMYGQLVSEKDMLGHVTSYAYNELGQQVETTDPYGIKTTYVYNPHNQLIETQIAGKTIEKKKYDAYGREQEVVTLSEATGQEYDAFGRVIKIINKNTGVEETKVYDHYGNVIEEKDSEGKKTTYSYDTYNRVIKTVDSYGRTQTQDYDARGNVVKTKDYQGQVTTTTYTKDGLVETATDNLGVVTTKEYNDLQQVVKETVGKNVITYHYDALNRVISQIKNGKETKTSYDNNDNVVSTTDALGNVTSKKYDAKNQVIEEKNPKGDISTIRYDALGRVIEKKDPLGNKQQTIYAVYGQIEKEIDRRGFFVEYIYNDDLQVVEVIDKLGAKTKINYNDKKQKIKQTAPNGAVTSYAYDGYGRVIKQIEPSGKVIETKYDVLGNVIEEQNGSIETKMTYDHLGNLIETWQQEKRIEKQSYNKYNQVIEKEDAKGTKSYYTYDTYGNIITSNEKGFQTKNEYDKENILIKKTENDSYIEEYTYDKKQRLLETKVNGQSIESKEYDALGNEIKVIKNGVETRYHYDALQQVIEVQIPSSTTLDFITYTKNRYDEEGNVIEQVDSDGYKEIKKYDGYNNVIEEVNKKGVSNKYQYDSVGNLIKVQNDEGRYIHYEYDTSNNVIYKTNNGRVAKYNYDQQNNLLKQEDEYGYVREYQYNRLNQKISYTKPDGTVIPYAYDLLGNTIQEGENTFSYDTRDNLITSSNSQGEVTNEYDVFDNLIKTKDVYGKVVEYTYTKENQVESKTYGDQEVRYTYTPNGAMHTVANKGEEVATYFYNRRGEVEKIQQGDIVTTNQYDNKGRLVAKDTLQQGKSIYQETYAYDQNDNLVKEVNGKENIYQYDAYDELISSEVYVGEELVTTTYAYDVFGNQTVNNSKEGTTTYHYNNKNQVEEVKKDKGSIKYTYNKNGNVESKKEEGKENLRYVYNEQELLKEIRTEDGLLMVASYDASGNRVLEVTRTVVDFGEVKSEQESYTNEVEEEKSERKSSVTSSKEGKESKNNQEKDTREYVIQGSEEELEEMPVEGYEFQKNESPNLEESYQLQKDKNTEVTKNYYEKEYYQEVDEEEMFWYGFCQGIAQFFGWVNEPAAIDLSYQVDQEFSKVIEKDRVVVRKEQIPSFSEEDKEAIKKTGIEEKDVEEIINPKTNDEQPDINALPQIEKHEERYQEDTFIEKQKPTIEPEQEELPSVGRDNVEVEEQTTIEKEKPTMEPEQQVLPSVGSDNSKVKEKAWMRRSAV